MTAQLPNPNSAGNRGATLSRIRVALRFLALPLFCCAQLLDALAFSGANVALPRIQRDLGFTVDNLQWVISAYGLTFAGFLLLTGRLGDAFGHRTLFIGGLVWFAIFSIASGASSSPMMMIIFRGLQGIGAAATVPNAIALIIQIYPKGRTRDRAMSLFASSGAVGFVLGLIMGGFLTESTLGWPFSFHIPGIIAFAVATFAIISLPPGRRTGADADLSTNKKRPSIDYLGAVLCTAAMLMLVFCLSEGNARGWSDPLIISFLILSLALFGAFIFAEMKIKDPLMPPRIWLLPNFAAAFVIAMCVTAFFVNYTYYLTLIFQEVWGYNAVQSAIRFVPVGVVAVIIALLAESLIHYFNIKMTLMAGLLLGLIGNVVLGFYNHEYEYWSKFFPSVVIGIAGLSSTYTSVAITAFSAAPNDMAGLIGGVLNTAFQFGTGLGLAITTPIVSSVNGPSSHVEGGDRHNLLRGYHAAIWTTVGIIGFALLIAVIFVKVIDKSDEDLETETVSVESVEAGRRSKEEEVTRHSDYSVSVGSTDTVAVQG